jgi:hypothetical protein
MSSLLLVLALLRGEPMTTPETRIDHLLVGVADLDEGVKELTAALGVAPVFGGKHPRGTQNALLSLGDRTYLELIALQPGARVPGMEKLAELTRPTPIGWAVSARDAASLRSSLTAAGFALQDPQAGSRITPAGAKLEWRTLGLASEIPGAPFFIVWGKGTPHPSTTSPTGCALTGLRIATPEDEKLRKLVTTLGVNAVVVHDAKESYRFAFQCPNGRVTFSGDRMPR